VPDERTPEKAPSRVSPQLVVAAVLVAAAVVFVVQNSDKAKIRFLFIDVHQRVWVALLIAIAVGAAVGYLVARRGRQSGKR